MKIVSLAFTFCLLSFIAHAEAIPEKVDRKPYNTSKRQIITLAVENDLFGRGTDQHYTNGVRASYLDLDAEFPNFIEDIAKAIPTFDLNDTTIVSYSVGQNLFTPDDITIARPNRDDRPYAAFLYGSAGLTTMHQNGHVDDLELTIGVVGPLALGEETQRFVHQLIDSQDPKGWSHQIDNELGLMASWQRRFPVIYKEDFGTPLTFTAEPFIGATLGNIYTYGNTGLSFKLGPGKNLNQDTPMRVRPALPGSGYFDIPENKWSWYLFSGIEGRYVARNIFLDGNTFDDDTSIEKRNIVYDLNAGIAFTFGRTRLSYTMVYRSEEFYGQNTGDVFGALSLGYAF